MSTSLFARWVQHTRRVSGICCSCLCVFALSNEACAQSSGVSVIALRTNSNPKRYVYTVQNGSAKTIIGVRIGEGADKCELSTPPLGWTADDGLPATSWSASSGWTVEAFGEEESPTWCIDVNPMGIVGIAQGGTAQVVIEAEHDDNTYMTTPVLIYFRDGTQLSVQAH